LAASIKKNGGKAKKSLTCGLALDRNASNLNGKIGLSFPIACQIKRLTHFPSKNAACSGIGCCQRRERG
jgi:hypothetical protein